MSVSPHPLVTVGRVGEEALGQLDADLAGSLVLPNHPEYEQARSVWNGLINRYPAAVVRAAGPDDVARALRFAQEHDVELSVRSGAHHQTGSAIAENGLVVDLSGLDRVDVDPEAKVATVGPGARAQDVLAVTQEHGLAPPTGSAGSVGMGGTTLNGGIGWIRRAHGLSVDALRRAEVVTADGTVREASPDRNEDLFWALRGGAGNFGVVTEFEFDCYDVGPLVAGLGVYYPGDAAEAVLDAHREIMDDAPEALSTILVCGHVPALPGIPEDLYGEDAVALLGCYAGDPEDGMKAIEPLRSIADPLVDMSDPMPYEKLHGLGNMIFPWGRNYSWRSVFVEELTDEIHDLIHRQMDVAPGLMDTIDIWRMGGRIGHSDALPLRWTNQKYMIIAEANWDGTGGDDELRWVRETERRLREAGGMGTYAGYTGAQEREDENWAAQVYGDHYDRLAAIKAEYDPDNVLRHTVNVEPADTLDPA